MYLQGVKISRRHMCTQAHHPGSSCKVVAEIIGGRPSPPVDDEGQDSVRNHRHHDDTSPAWAYTHPQFTSHRLQPPFTRPTGNRG